jgi:hypothetical protein
MVLEERDPAGIHGVPGAFDTGGWIAAQPLQQSILT